MSTTAQRQRRRFTEMASEHAELIGRRIRQAREEKDLTQSELAARIPGKADGSQLSKWERGEHRPGDDTLRHIARILEKSVAWFHCDPADKSQTPDPFLADELSQLDRIELELAAITRAADELKEGQFDQAVREMEAQKLLEEVAEAMRRLRPPPPP